MRAYERLTAAELDVGTALGSVPCGDRPDPAGRTARAALEQVVADTVVRDPCFVLFSGGRDSSLVLALATRAARHLGVPDPVPVTAVYPGDDRADESDWQDLVLRHLGITERVVLSFTDERSVLGPLAVQHLRRRGLVWPDAVHTQPAFFAQLGAGSVLTGEGGDMFIDRRRITPLTLLRTASRRPSGALLRAAAAALAPAAVDRRRLRRTFADPELLPWLRPAARERLADDQAALRGPLRWDAATWALSDQRANQLALGNAVVGAAEYGLVMRHPIADPAFVAALAAEGARWGFRGRTSLFRHLGADLLPDAVLARQSKAAFNRSRWTAREREFARSFSGGAFDAAFIDEERLRAAWLGEQPHPVSYFLAHVAWLRQEGLPLEPAGVPSPSASATSRASVSENGGPQGSRAT